MADIRVQTFTSVYDETTTYISKFVAGRIETNHTVESNEDFSQITHALPMPLLGEPCIANTFYNDGSVNWNCIQAHNRTADNPIDVPALFRQYRAQGQPWVQPIDQYDSYFIGDWVTHNDKMWRTLIDVNVWEPGAVGSENLWEEILE